MIVRLARLPFVALRRLVVAVSLLALGLCGVLLAVFVFWGDIAEELTTGRRPAQFRGELQAELLDDYAGIFGVGHNSGGTIAATIQALDAGADVIEIDVASLDGELVSAHFPPLPIVGRRVFRGPTLEEVWAASAPAEVIKLDLKETSAAFQRQVCDFLEVHGAQHQVIIASRDQMTLDAVDVCASAVFTFASLSTDGDIAALRGDPVRVARIDGVTIRESLVDQESAEWLASEGLYVVVWTVNGLSRVNELVLLGIDGITTDNLAIMSLLGGQQRGEPLLTSRASPPQPGEQPPEDEPETACQEERPRESHPLLHDDQADLDDEEVLRDEQHEEGGSDRGQRKTPCGPLPTG